MAHEPARPLGRAPIGEPPDEPEFAIEDPYDWYLLGRDSDREPVLSVVMPTLNEEASVADCIESVREVLVRLRLPGEVIVADSSEDRTAEIAAEYGAIVVEPDDIGYG